jgi:ring-1,2-phenylacetyl-CoA epoxidase subunit PaaD
MVAQITRDTVMTWLDEVPDPEIPVISVVDLGVVRDIDVTGNAVTVTITPTYSGCPAMSVIAFDIQTALAERGIKTVNIETRIAPPWTTDWLSDKGRARLEDYGIAPPQAAGRPDRCPQCRSASVSRVSQFGSTPCKAQWRCDDCLEPFDYFKCI